MICRFLIAAPLLLGLAGSPAFAQPWEEHRHHPRHEGWHDGDIHRFHERDVEIWRGGRWFRGWHEGRDGWWWVVGVSWYYYPAPVYPYPDPYLPPTVQAPAGPPGAMTYYCPNPEGYYPYIAQCFVPWQAMQARPAPQYQQQQYQQYQQPSPQQQYQQQGGYYEQPQQGGGIDKSTGGTIVGAIGGAVAGAQFGKGSGKLAATAIGTLLGGFIGHEVGNSLDQADQMSAQQAERNAYAAPLGQGINWNNPQSGNSGVIVPTRDGTDGNGNYCREFRQTITVSGQQQSAFGTACRQPDGSWKVVN